ncbi:DUF3089 domain-containing protein [Gammaproteobacteria bacterium]|nr:DUF3089 domain-containing protein [Gammaproteobacteria bacterium]MDC1300238.1 DUF3089 domain-containing protein [Gammaproteobacteria bacterium]
MTPKEKYLQFIQSVKPQAVFLDDKEPSSPDYQDDHSWAALPGRSGSHLMSPDEIPSNEYKDYDVFYIHPTGYFQPHWNAPLEPESAAFERTESHLATQASAFSASCNVYAPYYRQATYFSFFDREENGRLALDLAYSDISKAFNFYIQEQNQGRPFFIAGHSQGALHGQRLIHEHISQQPIKKQFIAAYLAGYILPVKHFDSLYPDLIASNNPEDYHSIISWCTGVEGFRRSRAHSAFWSADGWCQEPMEQPLVCQNPLSWSQDSAWVSDETNISIRLKSSNLFLADYHATAHSHAKLSIESMANLGFEAKQSEHSMIEVKGSLIDKVKSFTVDGDLHNFDVSLFWGSIRDNVKRRAHAFKK